MDGSKATHAVSTATSRSTPTEATLPSRHARFEQPNASEDGAQLGTKTNTGIQSEHGHHLTKIQPLAKHSGNSVATFFNGLFTTMIALSTLGTSITFSFVLSNQTSPPPPESRYDANSVQFFLAISWLLFLLCLAVASLGSTLLTFFRKHWVHDWDGEHGKRSQLSVQLYAVGISAIMGGLTIAAFIFMCLVIVAFQSTIGWISLGFTSLFGIVVVISICNQVPWPWIQRRTPNLFENVKGSLA